MYKEKFIIKILSTYLHSCEKLLSSEWKFQLWASKTFCAHYTWSYTRNNQKYLFSFPAIWGRPKKVPTRTSVVQSDGLIRHEKVTERRRSCRYRHVFPSRFKVQKQVETSSTPLIFFHLPHHCSHVSARIEQWPEYKYLGEADFHLPKLYERALTPKRPN